MQGLTTLLFLVTFAGRVLRRVTALDHTKPPDKPKGLQLNSTSLSPFLRGALDKAKARERMLLEPREGDDAEYDCHRQWTPCVSSQRRFPKKEFEWPEEELKQWPEGLSDSPEEIEHWSHQRLDWATKEMLEMKFPRFGSPKSWSDEIIYEVVVDRFANGDLRNDLVNVPKYQFDQWLAKSAPDLLEFRTGGDLRGIRKRLDYFKDLGVTALHLTPIFLNKEGDHDGYCVSDMTKIDPSFGTIHELQALVFEAHRRGILIILDIVLNSLCDRASYYKYPRKPEEVRKCVKALHGRYKYGQEAPERLKGEIEFSDEFMKPLLHPEFFNRCGNIDEKTFHGRTGTDDEDWESIEAWRLWSEFFAPYKFDFDTTNPYLQEILPNLYAWWIEVADIDGFRIDAAGHISPDMIVSFTSRIRQYAYLMGKRNFLIVGEVIADPMDPAVVTNLGRMTIGTEKDVPLFLKREMDDHHKKYEKYPTWPFPGVHALYEFTSGNELRQALGEYEKLGAVFPFVDVDRIEEVLEKRNFPFERNPNYWSTPRMWEVYHKAGRPRLRWNVLESESWGRVLGLHNGAHSGDMWRAAFGLAWLLTVDGMPSIFHGQEHAMNGICWKSQSALEDHLKSEGLDETTRNSVIDKCHQGSGKVRSLSHQCMWSSAAIRLGSAVPSINSHRLIRNDVTRRYSQHWCDDPVIDQSHAVYELTRRLTRIRRSCQPMRRGTLKEVHRDNNKLAFWRVHPKSKISMLVILWFGTTAHIEFQGTYPLEAAGKHAMENPGEEYIDLLNPTAGLAKANANQITVEEPQKNSGYNVAIYIPKKHAVKHEVLGIYMCDSLDDPLVAMPAPDRCPPLPSITLTVLMLLFWLVPACFCFQWRKAHDRPIGCVEDAVRQPDPPFARLLWSDDPKQIRWYTWEDFVEGWCWYICCQCIPLCRKMCKNPDCCYGDSFCGCGRATMDMIRIDEVYTYAHERLVMVASIEHSIPHLNIQVVQTSVGKTVDLMVRHSPAWNLFVHPMVGNVDYDLPKNAKEEDSLTIMVDQEEYKVRVWSVDVPVAQGSVCANRVILLQNDLFESRSKATLYPSPMSCLQVLSFYSLWNQAVSMMIRRYQPDIYYCMEAYSCLAPWYVWGAMTRTPRMLLHLHDAEDTGSIGSDEMSGPMKRHRIARIFNLTLDDEKPHYPDNLLYKEGRFCLLRAGLKYVKFHQKFGVGLALPSAGYCRELSIMRPLYWWWKGKADYFSTPFLDSDKGDTSDDLTMHMKSAKRAAKAQIQAHFGLETDLNAPLFVVLGRLTKKRGSDIIADVTLWLLQNYPTAQLIVLGPIGDLHGRYAAVKLEAIASRDHYRRRCIVQCGFVKASESLRLAADFYLAPSRNEPFGYIDAELAARGVITIGAETGGLGKAPGFYYPPANRENQSFLCSQLRDAITAAMKCDSDYLLQMSEAAIGVSFPLKKWVEEHKVYYERLMRCEYGGAWHEIRAKQGAFIERDPPTFTTARKEFFAIIPTRDPAAPPQEGMDVIGMFPDAPTTTDIIAQNPVPMLSDVEMDPAQDKDHRVGKTQTSFLTTSLDDEEEDEGGEGDSLIGQAGRKKKKNKHKAKTGAGGPQAAILGRRAVEAAKNPGAAVSELVHRGKQAVSDAKDAMARQKEVRRAMRASAAASIEFLRQEHTDEELDDAVLSWMEQDDTGYSDNLNPSEIIEGIAHEREAELETGLWAKFLHKKYHGIRVAHWILFFGYVCTPVGETVTAALAGLGSTGPDPVEERKAILRFWMSHSLGNAFGTLFYWLMAKLLTPRWLLVLTLLAQLPMIGVIAPILCIRPHLPYHTGWMLVASQSFLASGNFVILSYNFLASVPSELHQYANRVAYMECGRHVATWLIASLVWSSQPGTGFASDSQGAIAPLVVICFLIGLAPALMLVKSPWQYKQHKLPVWNPVTIRHRKSFLMLTLSEWVGALAQFPSIAFLQWWVLNGWTTAELGGIAVVISIFLAGGSFLWCKLLTHLTRRGPDVLIIAALFLWPPTFIRAYSIKEAGARSYQDYGVVLCVACTMMFDIFRMSAHQAAKVQIAQNRWRVLTYNSITNVVTHILRGMSPWMAEHLAKKQGLTFEGRAIGQHALAEAAWAAVWPLMLIQVFLQIYASKWMADEMEVFPASKVEL